MCMGVLSAYTSVHHMCAWCPGRSKEGVESLGPGVTGGVGHHMGVLKI